jgi:hypothetical protein
MAEPVLICSLRHLNSQPHQLPRAEIKKPIPQESAQARLLEKGFFYSLNDNVDQRVASASNFELYKTPIPISLLLQTAKE